jgi:hypothetical protein
VLAFGAAPVKTAGPGRVQPGSNLRSQGADREKRWIISYRLPGSIHADHDLRCLGRLAARSSNLNCHRVVAPCRAEFGPCGSVDPFVTTPLPDPAEVRRSGTSIPAMKGQESCAISS